MTQAAPMLSGVLGPAGSPDREGLEVSILMPCLNEAETLEGCIYAAAEWLNASGCDGEIVVADNGSTDGSVEIAERSGARVVHVPMRGYGAALYFGCRAARGRFIVMGDSDQSYDFSNLSPFIERLRAGDDLVMGNRFRGGIERGAMPLKNRYFGNPLLSALGRLFFRAPIGDFYCGLRGFTKDAFERMDLRTTGMEFASEMVIKATLAGMHVSEVPTTLKPDGRSRRPHLRPWRDGWRGLRYMLLCSPRWLFLYPGALAMIVGLAVGGWLFLGPRRVGQATLDVHTLLYSGVFVLLGYQAILFAIFSRLYASQHGLLPPSVQLERAFRRVTLETGLLAGGALIVGGLALSMMEVLQWRSLGFGPLNIERTMRIVTLAAVSLTLGVQTVFASFFLSVLGLTVRQYPPGPAE
jgi:glycosyltransferase involved in cell wall biosynthesis